MPMVNDVIGTAPGSNPKSRQTGTPSRLPTQSCRAESTADTAAR